MKDNVRIQTNTSIIVKIIITHLVMSIFGLMVYLPFSGTTTSSLVLVLIAGILSILMYLYFIHLDLWMAGARDSVLVEKPNMLRGLFIGFMATIPELVICISYTILAYFQAYSEGLGKAYIVVGLIATLWDGMFLGVRNAIEQFSGNTSFIFKYYFLFTPIITIAFSQISYLLGRKQKFGLRPKDDRKEK